MRWTLFWGGPEHNTVKPIHEKHLRPGGRFLCPVVRRRKLAVPVYSGDGTNLDHLFPKVLYSVRAFLYADGYGPARWIPVLVYAEKEDRLWANFEATLQFIFWMCENPLLAYLGRDQP